MDVIDDLAAPALREALKKALAENESLRRFNRETDETIAALFGERDAALYPHIVEKAVSRWLAAKSETHD